MSDGIENGGGVKGEGETTDELIELPAEVVEPLRKGLADIERRGGLSRMLGIGSLENVASIGKAMSRMVAPLTDIVVTEEFQSAMALMSGDFDRASGAWPKIPSEWWQELPREMYERTRGELTAQFGELLREDLPAALNTMRTLDAYLMEEEERAMVVVREADREARKELWDRAWMFVHQVRARRFYLRRMMRLSVLFPGQPLDTEADSDALDAAMGEVSRGELMRYRIFPKDASFRVFLAAWYHLSTTTPDKRHANFEALWNGIAEACGLSDKKNIREQATAGNWYSTGMKLQEVYESVDALAEEIGVAYLVTQIPEFLSVGGGKGV